MVLTDNFRCFVRSILLSNSAANGVVCSDSYTARRGWYGAGNVNESVAALAQLTDTSNNNYTCGIYGSVQGTNGHFGQQASLNKFDPENTYGTSDTALRGLTFFKVGTGNTAATANDCDLENEIPAENVKINLSSVHLMENGSGVLRFIVSVKNIGTEPMSVSEIGMFKYLTISNYETSTRTEASFLFGRNILPSAVTIAPQGIRMFVVDIKI